MFDTCKGCSVTIVRNSLGLCTRCAAAAQYPYLAAAECLAKLQEVGAPIDRGYGHFWAWIGPANPAGREQPDQEVMYVTVEWLDPVFGGMAFEGLPFDVAGGKIKKPYVMEVFGIAQTEPPQFPSYTVPVPLGEGMVVAMQTVIERIYYGAYDASPPAYGERVWNGRGWNVGRKDVEGRRPTKLDLQHVDTGLAMLARQTPRGPRLMSAAKKRIHVERIERSILILRPNPKLTIWELSQEQLATRMGIARSTLIEQLGKIFGSDSWTKVLAWVERLPETKVKTADELPESLRLHTLLSN